MNLRKSLIQCFPGKGLPTICIVVMLLISVLINIFPSIKPTSSAEAISDWTVASYNDFEEGTFNNSSLEVKLNDVELACINFLGEWNKKNITFPPHARCQHTLAPIWGTDKIFLFGGIDYNLRYNDVWIYNVTNNSWTCMDIQTKPSTRYGHGGVSIWGTDQVLIYGGAYGNFETWIYDYSENKWIKKIRFLGMGNRHNSQMTFIWGSKKAIIFGGLDTNDNLLNDTWLYDVVNDTWNVTSPKNSPGGRYFYAMSSIHGTDKVLLYGGQKDDKIFLRDTWIYDLSDNNWTNMNTINNPGLSSYMEMAPMWGTDKMILYGRSIDGKRNETWMYDYGNNSWKKIHSQAKPDKRYWFEISSIWGVNRIILFGGVDATKPFDEYNSHDETWIYTPYDTNRYVNGTYISTPFDTKTNSTFKTISWKGNTSINTSIKIQFRTAPTASELKLTNFAGPDGAPNSFYTISPTTIWPGHEIDRWMQFKIYLNTTNSLESPKLNSIKIVYNNIPSTSLFSPFNESILSTNKPLFVWNFTDLDSTSQTMFQVLIDDDPEFGSIDYDSDGQSSNNQNWQFPEGTAYSTISDGTWYWKVRTKDNDGDWGYYSRPLKIIIDTKQPCSLITFPVENGSYNNLSAIFGIANDTANGTGLKKMEISIQELENNNYWSENGWIINETWLNVTGLTNWTYYTYEINWSSGVQYHIRSRSYDIAGNVEIPGDGIKFMMDWDEPRSTILSPERSTFVNNINSISGNSYDISGSGIDFVEIYIERFKSIGYWNGTGWNPNKQWLRVNGTETWSYESSSVSWSNGYEYGLYSRAVDNAGNVGDPSDMVNVTYDIREPYSYIELPENNSYINKIETISGRSSDDESFFNDRVEISIQRFIDDKYWTGTDWDINESWLITEGSRSWYFNASTVHWLTDITYRIRSRAVDLAGNIEMTFDEIIFMYDDQPPGDLLISINDGRGYTNNNIVSIRLNATDFGSGVDLMSFSTDGVTWTPWEKFVSVITFTLPGAEGTKSLSYRVIDRAGNSASTSETIIFDTTPPEDVSISINAGAVYTNNSDVVLDLNAVDTLSGLNMMAFSTDGLDMTSWRQFSNVTNLILHGEDGERLIVFHVSDKAGNIATASDTIILDTKPPESLWISINKGAKSTDSNSVVIKLYAIDLTSEVNMMSFSFDNKIWSDWIQYSSKINYNLTNINGEVTIYFRVNDLAGNVAEPLSDSIFLNISSQDNGDGDKPLDEQTKDTSDLIIIILIILLILSILVVYFYFKRKRKRVGEDEVERVGEKDEKKEEEAEVEEPAAELPAPEIEPTPTLQPADTPALQPTGTPTLQPSVPPTLETPVPMPAEAPKPQLPVTTVLPEVQPSEQPESEDESDLEQAETKTEGQEEETGPGVAEEDIVEETTDTEEEK